jgi:predicted HTH domain antitoxin
MGTFLEFLEIGSREWGMQLKISLFPKGIDSMEKTSYALFL